MKKILLISTLFISLLAHSQDWRKYYEDHRRFLSTMHDTIYANLQYTTNTDYKFVVWDSLTKKFYQRNAPTSATPGIASVLAVNQNMNASGSINTTGSYKLQIANAAPGASSGFQVDLTSNATDATGDMFYRTSDGPMGRIAIGTAAQGLRSVSGLPVGRDTAVVPIKVLSSQYADASNVSTTETDLLSYTLPANTLANNGDRLVIEAMFTTPSNGNSKSMKFYFGALNIDWTSSTIANGATIFLRITVFKTASNAQRFQIERITGYSDFPIYSTATETDTGSIVIKFSGTGAASNDITQRTMSVTYYKAP